MSFRYYIFVFLFIFVIFSLNFCISSYTDISRFRPLKKGEHDLQNPLDPDEEIHFYISSGYRPKNNDLDRFVVSIRTSHITAYFGDNHFCTGVVVSSSLILTAAHCVVDGQSIVTRPKRLHVVAGTSYRLTRTSTTMEFTVAKVIPHLKFKRGKGYDIALLVLTDPIPKSNSRIKIISLETIKPPVGTKCITMGWGQLVWDGPYADIIVYGNLSIMDNLECIQDYGHHFTDDVLCTANPNDRFVDTCRGDSGAPLICNMKLVGLVSFSSMCSDQRPTIFTDVTLYNNWIIEMGKGKNIQPNAIILITMIVFGFV